MTLEQLEADLKELQEIVALLVQAIPHDPDIKGLVEIHSRFKSRLESKVEAAKVIS